jgi:heme/copper-type cytochrome/quinol oxidase subunit 2
MPPAFRDTTGMLRVRGRPLCLISIPKRIDILSEHWPSSASMACSSPSAGSWCMSTSTWREALSRHEYRLYERLWMWAAAVMIAMFVAVIGVSAIAYGRHPPSHVETIDPAKIFTDPRFSKIGQPVEMPDGTIEVQMAALMFAFAPAEVRVPAGRSIRFRMTSADVTTAS